MMQSSKVAHRFGVGLFFFFIIAVCMAPSVSAIPAVQITVGDTVGDAGEQNSVVTVFMTNVFDTVAAFELWLQLDRPDMMAFDVNETTLIDTTYWECTDWDGEACWDSISCDPDTAAGGACPMVHIDTNDVAVGAIDTVGCLTSGWQYVQTRSLTGTGRDVKITGIANIDNGVYKPGIGPQQGGVLFRLVGDIFSISDTVVDRSAQVLISSFKDHINFSRPDGTSIGILSMEVPDSNFYHCNFWVPPDSEECMDWQRVYPGEPWDSVEVGVDTIAIIDTSAIHLINGSVTVNLYPGACCTGDSVCSIESGVDGCEWLLGGTYKGNGSICSPNPCLSCCSGPSVGNTDGSADNLVTMGDLTVLIDHLFITLTPLLCDVEGNVDLSPDGLVTMGDLTVLIDHLFISLDPLPACP